MNTKNNKRRRASVERIKKTFLEFLKKREISKITVSDICKSADINRSTFYANFVDMYDLADSIIVDLQKDVDGLFEAPRNKNDRSVEFLELFKHIKEHQELYLFYFKLGYERHKLDPNKFFDIKEMGYSDNLDYHIEFFKNGFNAIVKMWLENGCRESPQQMRDILIYEYRGRFEK